MKRQLLGLLLWGLGSVMPLCAQSNFEGLVVYEVSFQSKNPKIPNAYYERIMGKNLQYYIKGGNYLNFSDGQVVVMQLYRQAENKMYVQTTLSDSLYWSDASENGSLIQSQASKSKALKILDYECDELTFVTATGKETYAYNAKLKVDPALYTKHAYNNWNTYTKTAGAVPLKIVADLPAYVMMATAIAVKPMSLEDTFFELPAKAPLAKSQF